MNQVQKTKAGFVLHEDWIVVVLGFLIITAALFQIIPAYRHTPGKMVHNSAIRF